MAKQTTKRFVLGTVIAAATGYIAGLLTAPKSGKETRKDIKDAASSAVLASEKQLKNLQVEMEDALAKAKQEINQLSGRTKTNLSEAIDKTQVVKTKVKTLISAIHDGSAEDKDLQAAVSEASKVLKHLQSFFTKS